MERKHIVEVLETVGPALSNNNHTPILNHFWFTEKNVTTFNDIIAVQVPVDTPLRCAVPANMLALLKASRAAEIKFTVEKDVVKIKAASSKLDLPSLPEKDFADLFKMPKVSEEDDLPVNKEKFIAGLEDCMRSAGTDVAKPDNAGVTLLYSDGHLYMFSTNSITITMVKLSWTGKGKPEFGERAILSAQFVKQLLRIARNPKKTMIRVTSKYAVAKCNDVRLWGALVYSENPLDFIKITNRLLDERVQKSFVPVPKKFGLMLERATIISAISQETIPTRITVADGRLRMHSKSDMGNVDDSTVMDDKHPDVALSVIPKTVASGVGRFPTIVFSETCVIMADAGTMYFVAAKNERKD